MKRTRKEAEEVQRKRRCLEKETEELAGEKKAFEKAKQDFDSQKDTAWKDIRETEEHVKQLLTGMKECMASANSRWGWKAGRFVLCLVLTAVGWA